MKFIKLKINKGADEVINMITNNARVNENVRFDEKRGIPHMHVKRKGDKIKIRCEMMGRPTKDNGFFFGGTVFYGRITERDGETVLSGVIITSPIYHSVVISLVLFNIYMAFKLGGIPTTLIPIVVFAIAFEFMFYRDEFRKQGYISRYLVRAFRRLS